MNARRLRPRLEPLEGRDAPANLTTTYSAVTRTLTVTGDAANNAVTVEADANDVTHFILSSGTDTFNGAPGPFAGPSGVRNLVFKMLAGDDSVTLSPAVPIRLAGSLTIDGGGGANTVDAAELTVAGGLTIRNGTNSAGQDTTRLINLNVGGGLTVANGDGDTLTQVRRDAAGASAVRGAVRVTNGTGADNTTLFDLFVGRGVTVQNGHAAASGDGGNTFLVNEFNTAVRSQVLGSVAVSFLDGFGSDGLSDVVINGNATFAHGSGTYATTIDGSAVAAPVVVRGSVTVTGSGPVTRVFVGIQLQQTGLVVGRNFTVAAGAGLDRVFLNRLTVGGAATLLLGDGSSQVTIDDAWFAGTFTLTTGSGTDEVSLDAGAGSGAVTTFERAVRLSLGAGNDALTVAGETDANQAVVYLSSFVVRHGAGVDQLSQSVGKELHPFGPGLEWVL